MNKIHNLPEWFNGHVETLDVNRSASFMPANTIAFERNGKFYFDGLLGAMLTLRRIPTTIEIALDLSDMGCLMRLNYGDETDEEAAYGPFEVESFALLWNANPKSVHGIHGNRISLCLSDADATCYPIICPPGVMGELFYYNGKFRVNPDPEFADELLDDAA